ncbi:HVO_2922 family protein [Haloferax mucosum]|nr:HVO_2922 family protein [Haloferax mucosum]
MSAHFELYADARDEWRWRLVHDNGNIIADSGEGYASKQGAQRGIESVKENAPEAPVVEG